jgi:hypothetical protein
VAEALQHYLPIDEIRAPFFVCTIFGCLFGTHTISSSSSQFKASQIRSKCSKFTLSAISWYNSPIVLGRIPVALAKSACVHLASPSFIDSKILIICRCSFRCNITLLDKILFLLLFYSGLRYILTDYDIDVLGEDHAVAREATQQLQQKPKKLG